MRMVGVGMALLEEVCHCRVGFEVSYTQVTPSDTVHFLLPVDQDIELLAASPAPCLPAMSHHDDNGLNL